MTTAVREDAAVTVREQLERYRSEHGLQVSLGRFDDRILLRTGAVEAVQMFELVAQPVLKLLSASGVQTPIIENTGTGYWTFLTGPAGEDQDAVCVRPARFAPVQDRSPLTVCRDWLCVIRSVAGVHIQLPGPHDPARAWRSAPVGRVSVGAGLAPLDRLLAVVEEHLG